MELMKGKVKCMAKKCPKCGLDIKGYPALSRYDNKTEICRRCGAMEAIEEWTR